MVMTEPIRSKGCGRPVRLNRSIGTVRVVMTLFSFIKAVSLLARIDRRPAFGFRAASFKKVLGAVERDILLAEF
jgi:hypothetical protein